MSKFSVKKPFTILVMVFIMIMLGVVSVTRMQLDLLPKISLPYIIVVTTYPGASPERVESTIAVPMESSFGTISGVKNVYSESYENYGLVELEFADGTDLDSVLVKVYTALDTVRATFPDDVGMPQVLEISTDMLANEYLAIGMEGKSIEEVSRFVDETIAPAIERQEGVANVTRLGMIEKSIQIELDQKKVDALNAKILQIAEDKLNDAMDELDEAKQKLEDGQKDLDKNKSDLRESEKKLNDSIVDLYQSQLDINDARKELEDARSELNDQKSAVYDELAKASEGLDKLNATIAPIEAQIATQQATKAALEQGKATLEQQKDAALAADPSADVTAIEAQIAAIDGQIATANTAIATYNGQITAILNAAKVTSLSDAYKALERAKMEAAAGFGSGDAQLAAGEAQIESGQKAIDNGLDQIKDADKQLRQGWDSIQSAQEQIDDGWEQYNDGLKEFERQKAEALRSANADKLLTLETLSQILYAQNFEMPAGYIDDSDDNSWLLKVGKNYESISEIEDLVLVKIDDIGDVRVKDVANLTVIDNTETTYTRLNGEPSVLLAVFKASTSGTNEVSKTVNAEAQRLREQYPGLSVVKVMDQGDYINLIVENVVKNMIIGAALAILILAIFLRDFLPTIVVAISIPLSVLTALVAMYFSGISLNMMSLSGMALGIGMLVDNSIVIIENIYRLRGRGIEAPRAAVQGTNQVAGAVFASTLTTVCVFIPMVYTSGMVRELMMPMSLTIIFCLLASLLISMTVVPAAGSTLLRKTKPKEHRFFDKIQDVYGASLSFCLKRKWIPLLVAIGLLVLSIWRVVTMGIVMIPEIASNQIEADITFAEDTDRAENYRQMDEFSQKVCAIDGIGSVAIITGGDESLLMNMTSDDHTRFSLMILTEDENAGASEVKRMMKEIEAAGQDLNGEFSISSGMDQMSQILGSGLSISVYGDDYDKLRDISEDLMNIVATVPGYVDITNGQEDADPVLHLNIDKNKAMRYGLTAAQIFMELNSKLTTSASAVTVTIGDVDMDVRIKTGLDPLSTDNIMDYKFPVTEKDDDGKEITVDHTLSEFAEIVKEKGVNSISRKNQSHYITVTAGVADGYNTTLLSRELNPLLEQYEMPDGYTLDLTGESESVNKMIEQMALVILLGGAFVYLVMVAQFQSLLSPFIILFTVPLAFTGGLLALWFTGENLSIISLMGFLMLLGTVVNNGIVFVDYTNQLRKGGVERQDALVATGKTRMRPILMTALTTILAESSLLVGDDMGSQMGRGMALVIAGGLAYATLMTLYIIPVMYDILFKKKPLDVDLGSESLDDIPDDAQEFINGIQ